MLTYEFIRIGFMPNPEINLLESQKEILKELKLNNIPNELNLTFKKIGIKFKGLCFYNPLTYNYAIDTLDFKINKSINKKKYLNLIKKYESQINKELDKNISYDGYTALTINNVNEEINLLKNKNFEPDVLVLKTLIDLLNPILKEKINNIIKENIIFENEFET